MTRSIPTMMTTICRSATWPRTARSWLTTLVLGLSLSIGLLSAQAQISLDEDGNPIRTSPTVSAPVMPEIDAIVAEVSTGTAAMTTEAADASAAAVDAAADAAPAGPVAILGFEDINLAWTMVGAILVMFMQAGFALLEGGLSRSKNAVNVLMKNYTDMVFGSIVFWALGFGLMFGMSWNGVIGLSFFAPSAAHGHDYAFMIFQMMFAATAATIVSGACAERTKYSAYLINAVLITVFTYSIFGHWAWGGFFYSGDENKGWLNAMGFLDFAGSTVVHSIGGWSALAAIIVIGPRLGRFSPTGEPRPIPGHNLMLVSLGGFILWFGWFGFNAGSTLAASEVVGKIMLNTHLAGCAGTIGAMLYLRLQGKRLLLTGSVNGGLGGLVAITAGCNVVSPLSALTIGLIAGMIVTWAGDFITNRRLDDVVGAVAVHGFGGAWGTLATGIFFDGDDVWLNWGQIGVQAIGVGTAFVWAFGCTWIFYSITKLIMGVRVSTMHEMRGLDYTEHDEVGYPEFDPTLLHADSGKGA